MKNEQTNLNNKEWDAHNDVIDLIERTEELRNLYKQIGYSPYIEKKTREILKRLNNLEVSVPDFSNFQKSIDDLLAGEEQLDQSMLEANSVLHGDTQLLKEIIKYRNNKETIIKLLNKDYTKTLPFSVECSVIVRKPRDTDMFQSGLKELEELFNQTWLPQSKEMRLELLEKVNEIREELQSENKAILSALESLNIEVENACYNIADDAQDEKKRHLDDLLFSLVYIRHEYKPDNKYFVDGMVENVKAYLDNPWMHTPWLTKFILEQFLDTEVVKNIPEYPSEKFRLWVLGAMLCLIFFNFNFIGWLIFVLFVSHSLWIGWNRRKTISLFEGREEIKTGSYNGLELIRRFRELERKGIYVHSLIFGLLELP